MTASAGSEPPSPQFPDRHALTIPLLIAIHIATGVASAGVTLASGNITLKLAPRGDAIAYLAVISLVNSLAAGTASMVGGLTAHFFLSRKQTWRDTGSEIAIGKSLPPLSIG